MKIKNRKFIGMLLGSFILVSILFFCGIFIKAAVTANVLIIYGVLICTLITGYIGGNVWNAWVKSKYFRSELDRGE